MRVFQRVQFITGEYLVVAFEPIGASRYLAILGDEHEGATPFIVATFKEGDSEWNEGQYVFDLPFALNAFQKRSRAHLRAHSVRLD